MLVMDDLLSDLAIPHETDAPLGPRTWLGIGGNARVLAHPQTIDQLARLARRCREAGVPIYVLGAGANLLIADEGVDGVVVLLDAPAFTQWTATGGCGSKVTVGAGYQMFKFVNDMARAGLAGIEVLAGIPATIGGAIRMNAGGTFGDISRCVATVTVMNDAGELRVLRRNEIDFAYRNSHIAERFILAADFQFEPQEPAQVTRRLAEVRDYKQKTQPLAANSAGCTFKNPPPDPATGQPRPAGRLIDLADLKGTRIGGATVSQQHANFIECAPDCRASDVLALIEQMQRVVKEKFGVELEREVVVWP